MAKQKQSQHKEVVLDPSSQVIVEDITPKLTSLFNSVAPGHPFIVSLPFIEDKSRFEAIFNFLNDPSIEDSLSSRIEALEKDFSIPARNSLINGVIPVPNVFMQGDNLFIIGVNVPFSVKLNKALWWQHVNDAHIKDCSSKFVNFLQNLGNVFTPFNFCDYKHTREQVDALLKQKFPIYAQPGNL